MRCDGKTSKAINRAHVRIFAGAVLTMCIVGRPIRLTSVRWWLSPEVASSLCLTIPQQEAIDRVYREPLAIRRRLIEQLVEASDRVDQLLRDGADNEETLKETQAVARLAAEERALTKLVGDQVAAVLSPEQREKRALLITGQIVD